MQETRVPCLGGEDPLKEEMAVHYHILAWKIPWTGEPGRLESTGPQNMTEHAQLHTVHTMLNKYDVDL